MTLGHFLEIGGSHRGSYPAGHLISLDETDVFKKNGANSLNVKRPHKGSDQDAKADSQVVGHVTS